MKKVLFFMSFFLLVGMTSNAQTAKKACCAGGEKKACSKTSASASADMTESLTVALAAAEGNENIQTRQCKDSGATAFYEKSVCENSGKVSWSEVKYDADNKAFTQVASATAERVMVDEAGATLIDATAPKGKTAKKACCSKKGGKASCGSKKASASTELKAAPSKVQMEQKSSKI